jgi:hypothetical protein
MQRKPLFLAAAVAELTRFVALAFLAGALGAFRKGEGLSPLYRYLAVPQLLFAAAFFFLWLDRERYEAYRPLTLVGKGVSILAFIPLGLFFFSYGADSPQAGGLQGPIAALFSLCVDFFGLLVLIAAGRGASGAKELTEGGGTAPAAPKVGDGKEPGAQADARIGPSGPEDIENVEDTP